MKVAALKITVKLQAIFIAYGLALGQSRSCKFWILETPQHIILYYGFYVPYVGCHIMFSPQILAVPIVYTLEPVCYL